MALDGDRRAMARDTLDDIGIQRALRQPGECAPLAGFLLEDGDELAADALAFVFGVDHPFQLVQEAVAGINAHEAVAKDRPETLLHFRSLVGAQEAVVDEDAGQPLADRTAHQQGGDARIYSAAEGAEHTLFPD